MNRIAKTSAAVLLLGAMAAGLTACTDDDTKDKETKAKLAAYERLVAGQPSETMDYSPTREALNKWVTTWGKGGAKAKLSYIYLQNGKGEYGYFVMKGLPVPRCKMLTSNTQVVGSNQNLVNSEIPGMDGTYTASGTCGTYFGYDATTNAYMEFTVGLNQTYFLFDAPMTLPEFASAKPLGMTTIKP